MTNNKAVYPNSLYESIVYPFKNTPIGISEVVDWAFQLVLGLVWLWVPILFLYLSGQKDLMNTLISKSGFHSNTMVYSIGLMVTAFSVIQNIEIGVDSIISLFRIIKSILVIMIIAGAVILAFSLLSLVQVDAPRETDRLLNACIVFSIISILVSFYLFLYSKSDITPGVGSYEEEASVRTTMMVESAKATKVADDAGEFSGINL